ncbi:MAG TPA: chemotaxis protein CheX [Desulfuromonadaceae bacterium]
MSVDRSQTGIQLMNRLDPSPFRWVAKEDLLQRVTQGVSEFMALCADLDVNHECPPPATDCLTPAVTAMIAFDGDYLGLVWARCSEGLAVRMAVGMLGARPAGIDDSVRDVLGAMINILGGDVKLFLCRGGCSVDLSLPWVSHPDGNGNSHPDFISDPESMHCSFRHGEERLLVGLTVRKALETPQIVPEA